MSLKTLNIKIGVKRAKHSHLFDIRRRGFEKALKVFLKHILHIKGPVNTMNNDINKYEANVLFNAERHLTTDDLLLLKISSGVV